MIYIFISYNYIYIIYLYYEVRLNEFNKRWRLHREIDDAVLVSIAHIVLIECLCGLGERFELKQFLDSHD